MMGIYDDIWGYNGIYRFMMVYVHETQKGGSTMVYLGFTWGL